MHEARVEREFLSSAAAWIVLLLAGIVAVISLFDTGTTQGLKSVIKLPEPDYDSGTSVEQALLMRRSVREYRGDPLTFTDISQLLWAAQGVTDLRGLRTAPSAGALYPLEIYLIAGKVINLDTGVYKYRPRRHELVRVAEGDRRTELSATAWNQRCIKDGTAVIVISAVYERTAGKYGKRARRYVHIEAGHAAENIALQAVSLKLGAVFIGAFDDDAVKRIIGMEPDEQPIGIIPVGKTK